MPILVIAALLIAVLFWNLGRRSAPVGARRPSGSCRWVATGNDTVSLGEYRCKTCKVAAYAKGGKPPQECKRGMGGSL
ncbi:hypothetical protein [Yoonia sp. SDW83-1]|uniref:hypothetical protein n=1 Tax=Yoonia sp. SDW83-1 TaxID=3366945 RepID=UPI00398C5C66